jgi:two-component system, NarL family, response regulator DesR
MQPTGTDTTVRQPIFVTPNPLLIAGVQEVLAAAGMPSDPRIIPPNRLAETMAQAEGGLVILDGQALPETLAQLCHTHPQSRFVVWAVQPTADLLRIALECGVHGLLSTRLPLDEASNAMLRICRGERILRFDPGAGSLPVAKPLQFTARERHVLIALAGGASNAGIAATLHTTASTVKGCMARLFRKTGARNRRELAQSDTPRGAGGLMSWAVSKTAGPWF